MSAPSPFALVGSPTLRRAHRGGFTLVEVIVTLVVLAVLSSIAVVAYNHAQRGQQDRAGFPILGIAQVDARKVASGNGLRFPAQSELVAAMHSEATNAYGKKLAIADVEAGEVSEHLYEVAVLRGSGQVAGFAVLASSDGDWDHCYILVDDIKGGKHHAVWKYERGEGEGSECKPAVIVDCLNVIERGQSAGSIWELLTGGLKPNGQYRTGTPDDPYYPTVDPDDLPNCAPADADEVLEPLDPVPCVVAAPSKVDTSVKLAWAAAPEARKKSDTYDVQYQVQYAEDNGDANYDWRDLPVSTTTNYTVEPHHLDNGKRYVFRVRPQVVLIEDGERTTLQAPGTPWITSTRVITVPTTMPIELERLPGHGVRLSFQVPAGITEYQITRSPDPLVPAVREAATPGSKTFIDDASDWTPGVPYTYQVTFFYETAAANPTATCLAPAQNLGQISIEVPEGSEEQNELYKPLQAPAVTVENAPNGQGFNVTFATVEGAAKYLLRRSDASTPAAVPTVELHKPATEPGQQPEGWRLLPSPKVNPTQASVTVADPSAVAGDDGDERLFAYQVGVVDKMGNVTWGLADLGMLAPDAPVLTAETADEQEVPAIALSWSSVGEDATYQLYRSDNGTGPVLNQATPSATSHLDLGGAAGLEPGTQYTYTVRASNRTTLTLGERYRTEERTVGGTALSDPASARTRLGTGSTTVRAEQDRFVITWDAIQGASHYTVYGSNTGAAGSYTQVAGPIDKSEPRKITDSGNGGYAPGQTRFYKVVAQVGSNTSELAADADFLPPAYPVVNASVATPTSSQATTSLTLTATGAPDTAGLSLVVHNGNGSVMSPAPTDTDTSRAGLRATLTGVPLSTELGYGVSASLTKTITVPASSDGVHPARTFTITRTSAEAHPPAPAPGRTYTAGRTQVTVVTPPVFTKAVSDADGEKIELAWTKAGTVTRYMLDRADRATGTLKTGTTATDAQVEPGLRYTYRVTPVVDEGVVTTASAPVVAMTVPKAPSLTLAVAKGQLDVLEAKIGRSAGGDGYLLVPKGAAVDTVLRGLGGASALEGKVAYFDGTRYATAPFPASEAQARVLVTNGLARQTAYTFEAYAVNAAGRSKTPTSRAQCTAPAAPTAASVSLRKLSLSGGTWSLASPTWTDVTPAVPANWTWGNSVVLDVRTPKASRPMVFTGGKWQPDPTVDAHNCVTDYQLSLSGAKEYRTPKTQIGKVSADGQGGASITYFTGMSDNVPYTVTVTANGPGGSVSAAPTTVQAPSRYDMVVASHSPLRYYNFRPASGTATALGTVPNCAKLNEYGLCASGTGGELKVWGAKNCPIAPLTGACSSGSASAWARSFDKSATVGLNAKGMDTSVSPRDRAVTISRRKDPVNQSTIHLFDDTFTYQASGKTGYTLEAWVWMDEGKGRNARSAYSGEIVGWGGRFCTQKVVRNWASNDSWCSGNHLGVGGFDERISDYSTYVEGDALTGGAYVGNNGSKDDGMFAGGRLAPSLPDGGPSLNSNKHDRGGNEGANSMIKGGRWHLFHQTINYEGGRVRTQFYVDGRQTMEWTGSANIFAGNQCLKPNNTWRDIIDYYKAFQSCSTRRGVDTEGYRYKGDNQTALFERALRVGGLPRGNFLWYNGYNQMTSRWEVGERFHGFIDNVAVYRKMLTKAQMEQVYEAGMEIYNRTALPAKKS